jgi:hypothetical protein
MNNKLKDIIIVIEKMAPMLASALMSPAAGMAIQLLENTFGVSSDSLATTISQDPNALEKLQQLELSHSDTLAQYKSQDYQTEISDRKDARQHEEKIIQETGKRDWALDMIAVVFILFFFTLCVLNYFLEIKDDHVMVMLIGQVSAGVGLILSYYFGSSRDG